MPSLLGYNWTSCKTINNYKNKVNSAFMKNKISIIIPTYNCAGLLSEMVMSIINQTYTNWELIVVDDGSTDNTSEIMAKYSNDHRIEYVKRPLNIKRGAQGCRNYGFSLAKGEYVCFFDADDLISKTCLEERISFIVREECDYAIFPAATFQDDVTNYKLSKMGISTGEDILTSFLSHYAQFTVWTAIYKIEAIKNIHWDENIKVYQDLDFSMACIFKGLSYKFSNQNKPNYFYRFEYSDKCISSNHCTPEKFESTLYLFDKLLKEITVLDKAKSYKKDLLQFILFYYSRVLHTGTKEQERKLMKFVKGNYGTYSCLIFGIAKPFCQLTNNKRVVRLITMLFYYCFLRPLKMGKFLAILKSLLFKSK